MAEIKVTPRELRNKANDLQQLNLNFRRAVEEMVGYEAQLAGMWEGDAQKAFRKAFSDDRTKMERFAANIDKYVEALRTDAEKYETAENKNTAVATQRK